MALASRGAKTAGGTNFETGKGAILSSEVDADLNALVTSVNNIVADQISGNAVGSSELASGAVSVDAKVAALADIALTKLGDVSVNDAAQKITTDPGNFTLQVLPTTLDGEIKTLRHAIQRMAVGLAADTGDDAGTVGWYDPPGRGRNLLQNASFATDDDTADANVAPPGWALTATPPTPITLTTDAGTGDGNVLEFTGDTASDTGITQTLSLKDSTRYIVGALVDVDSGDTFTLKTTGALTTQLDIDSTSTSFAVVSGVFLTAATSTDVVVQFLAQTAGDVIRIRDAFCYECSDNPSMPSARHTFRLSTSTYDAGHITSAGWTGPLVNANAISISVNPIAGCQIRATGKMDFTVAANGVHVALRLQEDGTTKDASHWLEAGAGVGDMHSLAVGFTNMAPTPATALTYTMEGRTAAGTVDVNVTNTIDSEGGHTWLEVEVLFP